MGRRQLLEAGLLDAGLARQFQKPASQKRGIVKRNEDTFGFEVLPRCRVVEHTFACMGWNRGLA
jgi:hypothetical protein